jgi:excisionase family DNA binding protein
MLTTAEVAAMWRVDPKTVIRWIDVGRFKSVQIIQTPGKHYRYNASDMKALYERKQRNG